MDAKKVNELADKDRYEYLIGEVVKQKEIWLLQANDGVYAMFEDSNGQSYIPVWPGKEFAVTYAMDDWEDYVPEKMPLREFLEWMQELKADQIMIGAFPNSNLQSMAVDPIDLKHLLIKADKNKLESD
jgi:hypothetical protein